MQDIASFIALNRFGLGAAPGDAARVSRDPRGWIKSQIKRRSPLPQSLARFHASPDIMLGLHRAQADGKDALTSAIATAMSRDFTPEIAARTRAMIETQTPFAERMVLFWSNHFSISTAKRFVGPVIPAYEREAIRPYVFGHYSDMLKAVCSHPCMINYHDNALSIGERSRAGKQARGAGDGALLKETLARNILELYTLGESGDFDPADVTDLAKAISGWSHGAQRLQDDPRPMHGYFEFNQAFHEPGAKRVLGRTYAENGLQEGVSVLDDLARHPATARFIATKLVRHFVDDTPPINAVERITRVFQATEGDLAAVSAALVDLGEAWQAPAPKVKNHYELVISTYRATGHAPQNDQDILDPLRSFGQMPFSAPSPAGWSDRGSDWVAPEVLMQRIEWLRRFATRLPSTLYPETLLKDSLGPVALNTTRASVEHAPSGEIAKAMILASPEFQRR
ncbi:MAG: DUF1800 domain-containing protein [Thalassovita sp.]|nr:DUF1800 domain-containing protein [Thalassovita sp.]